MIFGVAWVAGSSNFGIIPYVFPLGVFPMLVVTIAVAFVRAWLAGNRASQGGVLCNACIRSMERALYGSPVSAVEQPAGGHRCTDYAGDAYRAGADWLAAYRLPGQRAPEGQRQPDGQACYCLPSGVRHFHGWEPALFAP